MASKSYPRAGYNGGALTELEHERLVHTWAPDGLIGVPSDPAPVYANNSGVREVWILAGLLGVLRGSQWDSGDTDIPISLGANDSGAQRIDLIVSRLLRADYSIAETVIAGVPGMGSPATVHNSDVWDLPLARVKVNPGDTTISASRVERLAWYIGDDGQILCTSTTRPPHYPDRIISETDTGRLLRSNGVSAWQVLAEDTGEVALSPAAGWSSRGGVVRRINGVVHLRMRWARNGTGLASGVSSALCTLPSGYRPAGDDVAVIGRMVSSTTGGMCAAVASPSGAFTLVSHGGLSSTSWIQMSASWPA